MRFVLASRTSNELAALIASIDRLQAGGAP
jgi:hypothetical protein